MGPARGRSTHEGGHCAAARGTRPGPDQAGSRGGHRASITSMSSDPPDYRIVSRKALSVWFLVTVIVMGSAGMLGVRLLRARVEGLETLSRQDAEGGARQVLSLLRWVLTPMLVVVAAMAVYLATVGYRTIVSACSPPPRSWVIEGQAMRTGRAAVRIGWVQIALSLLLLATAAYGIHFAWLALPRLLPG